MKEWPVRFEIAKNLKHYNELYDFIMQIIPEATDDYIDDFFNDFVLDNNYFDKQIMKNEVYDNFAYDIDNDTERSEFSVESSSDYDYYDTDSEDPTADGDDNYD